MALRSVVTALGLALPASGQLGRPTGLRIDVQSRTGNAGCVGVCRSVDGAGSVRFWVSARAPQATPGTPHKLYEFDGAGALAATHDQPTTWGQPSQWGMRDLAFDGTHVYGGEEADGNGTFTVHAFNVVTRSWDVGRDVRVNGLPVTVLRALAYNPRSDTFVTSDLGGAAYEFDRAGVVRGVHYATGALFMYGAGYDAVEDRYVWFSQLGDRDPTRDVGVVGVSFDPALARPDGIAFWGDLAVAPEPGQLRTPLGGHAGGFEVYRLASGERRFLCLAQGASDTVYELDGSFAYGTSCVGGSGAVARTGMLGEPFLGNRGWIVTVESADTAIAGLLFLGSHRFDFDVSHTGLLGCRLLLDPTRLLLDVAPATITGGVGAALVPLPVLPELSYASSFWQWVVVDPLVSNPVGMTLSRGGATVWY